MTLQSEMTPKLQTHSTWFLLLLYFHALLQNSTSLNFVQLRFLEEVLLNAIASLKWSDVKEGCECCGVEDVFCSPPSFYLTCFFFLLRFFPSDFFLFAFYSLCPSIWLEQVNAKIMFFNDLDVAFICYSKHPS